jgi:anti-sigma B factor antagonist
MEIAEKMMEDIIIISVSGRIDTITSKDLDAKLNKRTEEKTKNIILNLAKVDYISSVGLRVLLAALKRHKQNQGSMPLVSLQPFVQNVFKITGLDKIFQIFPTEETALESLSDADASAKK